jgi:hypothetical protein
MFDIETHQNEEEWKKGTIASKLHLPTYSTRAAALEAAHDMITQIEKDDYQVIDYVIEL